MAWSNKGERMADQVKAVDDFITALCDAGKIRDVSQLDHIKDDLENLLIKQVEEARHKKEAYIIAYTKTLDGRLLKSMICPVCHISRGYVVEKEGE